MFHTKPFIIGVAGGSGSGKTTIVKKLRRWFDDKKVTYLAHDNYYRDQSELPMKQRTKTNYDHPDSLETALLIEHLQQLSVGKDIEMPTYDFSNHTRAAKTNHLQSKDVIVVEGILIFADQHLRDEFDLKIFVDTPDDIRFIRRLKRDTSERGRSVESVVEQYLTTVRPMHQLFVEPSKVYADLIIPEGGENTQALQVVQAAVSKLLNG